MKEKLMNKEILIVGGLGYLGSNLSMRFLNDPNISLTIADRLNPQNISILRAILSKRTVKFFNVDITNDADAKYLLQQHPYDVVINLAAIVGAPLCKKMPNQAVKLNQDAAINLHSLIPERTMFFQASTGSCYGDLKEDCDETREIKPISLYAETKANVERKLQQYNNVVFLRFSTVYGLSIKTRDDLLINSVVKKAAVRDKSITVYEPNAMRNFIHVNDASESVFQLSQRKCNYNTYNIGNENLNLSKGDVITKIQDKYNFSVVYKEFHKDEDARNYAVVTKRLYSEIDTSKFQNKLDGEIEKLYEYYSYQLIAEGENA